MTTCDVCVEALGSGTNVVNRHCPDGSNVLGHDLDRVEIKEKSRDSDKDCDLVDTSELNHDIYDIVVSQCSKSVSESPNCHYDTVYLSQLS